MKKRLFGVFLAAAACVILLSAIRTEQLLHDMSQKVLRFHVLANSDEERDQDLKLKVRDAVGSFMAEQLKNADTIEQSRQIVNSNLEEICAQAQNVVEQEGYDYPVSAALVRTISRRKHMDSIPFRQAIMRLCG
ncbi:MAG: stage II sporulation protein R [Eubacterium sp.]